MDISNVINSTSGSHSLLELISVFTTVIIVLLIAVRSVIDVANGMGFLPKFLYKLLYKHETERIKNLLDEIGILPRKDNYKALTIGLDNPHLVSDIKDIKKRFKDIRKKYTEDVGSMIVGDKTQLNIRYYLNLRKAFCDGYDVVLIDLMARFIINEIRTNGLAFGCIASRKNALDLLGYMLSKIFNVPFILYHDQRSIFNPETGEIKNFDFIPKVDKKVLMVDDGCVGGNSILEMAKSLRLKGLEVADAFCFYSFSLASEKELYNNNIKLHYLECYDNNEALSNLNKENKLKVINKENSSVEQ